MEPDLPASSAWLCAHFRSLVIVFKLDLNRAERPGRMLLVLTIALLCPIWAKGDSTFVTGTAALDASNRGFSASGPELSFKLSGEDGPDLFSCTVGIGTPCDFTRTIFTYCSGFVSIGSYNGQTANCLGGELTFSSSPVLLPTVPSSTPFEYILPMTVSGQVIGYEGQDPSGPQVFVFDIRGAGTVSTGGATDIQGGTERYFFTGLTWQFSAVATTVPEPPALLLLGSGLLPLTMRLWSHLRQKLHFRIRETAPRNKEEL